MVAAAANLKNKTVLVTGGTGTIGSEIVRQLLKVGVRQVRVYSRDEHKQHELAIAIGKEPRIRYLIGDVRDKERLDFAFQGVDICFHAAALKHVPLCEYNPFEAVKTNVVGTQNVIDVSIRNNLERVIAISTDKAVDPVSVLGASKLMMERLITAANHVTGPARTRFASVRFGNVLHSRGSVVPLWIEQIQKGGPVTVTDERATRFFMEVSEAVGLVFRALEHMQGGEIFVLKMERKHKILDFAKELIKKYGDGKKIEIKVIGLRAGEKLHEVLLTNEESEHAIEFGEMFAILPYHISIGKGQTPLRAYRGAKRMSKGEYRSG